MIFFLLITINAKRENRSQQNYEEDERLKYLQQRKKYNLETPERRIYKFGIEKQKCEQKVGRKEGMADEVSKLILTLIKK
ncbi:MAG: hypothetical protein ABI763_04335 [Bacteroidota bacterium]